MPTLIRILRLLSIVIWVGGIIFFAFVLAPVAFHLLPSQHIAGIVVGGTLRVLDIVGLVCGSIFWATTVVLFRQTAASKGRYEAQLLLASVMLLATAYLHAGILPAMETDRTTAGGDIEAAPATDPAKIHFEKLHKRSEQVEGVVLFCGLGIVVLMARESIPADKLKS
jgi:uncharacterized membrane protein